MKKFSQILATGLGLGYMPIAPGTWGSLLGIPVALMVSFFNPGLCLLTLVSLTFIAIWVSDLVSKSWNVKDPSRIVIDEVCGMAIALVFLPFTLKTVIVAFLFFRLMDIIKPSPANLLEKLPGGYGIVLDDVMAGIYANLLVRILMIFVTL